MKNIQIQLVFSPVCNHQYPQVGIAILKAYLEQRGGCRVHAFDANAEFMEDYVVARMDRAAADLSRGSQLSADKAFALYQESKRVFASDAPKDRLRLGWARNVGDRVLPEIRRRQPPLVGISVVYPTQMLYALLLGRAIKAAMPQVHVVLGGPQISLFHRHYTSLPNVTAAFDSLMIGQGEEGLHRLVLAVVGGENLAGVPGLVSFDNEKQPRYNPAFENRDTVALVRPDYSDFSLGKYPIPTLLYRASIGCYYGKCSFCSFAETDNRTSEKEVVDDLLALYQQTGWPNVFFVDDAIHPRFAVKLAGELLNRGITNLRWAAFARLERAFTAETCRLLRKSGLNALILGLESASDELLTLMNKGVTLAGAEATLANLMQAAILPFLEILIGYPLETRAMAELTLDWLARHKGKLYFRPLLHPFGLLASPILNRPEAFGINSLDLTNPTHYCSTLAYPCMTKAGMNTPEILVMTDKITATLELPSFDPFAMYQA